MQGGRRRQTPARLRRYPLAGGNGAHQQVGGQILLPGMDDGVIGRGRPHFPVGNPGQERYNKGGHDHA
ncbi:hypothetical protein RAA17_24045 [Komagataeibacter rhaeticus]|nr:hypothetical protein [Komagataeibacter rhaeticus]